MKVKPNNFLVAPRMKTVVSGAPAGHVILEEPPQQECHYLHVDDDIAVAISHCSHDEIVRTHYIQRPSFFDYYKEMISRNNSTAT